MTGPASLITMAQNAIGRNTANLQDLGDITYELARPILKHITNPEQLRSLELTSPHIGANDAELWKSFIVRDIPDWKSKNIPSLGYDDWCYELYCKLKEDEENERQQQEDQLRRAMKQIDKKREANKSQILHKVVQQDVHRLPMFADGVRNPHAHSTNNRKPASTSLRSAKGGAQIIRALRQQSKQAVQAKSLATPFGATPSRFTTTKTINQPQTKLTSPTTKMRMSKFEDRESVGEKSLRLAIEAEQTAKEEKERQRRVELKKQRREQSVHNAFNRATNAESRSLSPPRLTQQPRGSTIRPASRSPVRRPVAGAGQPPIQRNPSPLKSSDLAVTEQPGKAEDPDPTIARKDQQEPASAPVHALPTPRRRPPVSIFAPKPKRRT